MLLGLRTVTYKVADLARAKAWYSEVFGLAPYFDQPFYVGFEIGGYELGLDPDLSTRGPGSGGALSYWGVRDIEDTMKTLATRGVTVVTAPVEVGAGIKVGTVSDPFGNEIGLIENPHFVLPGKS